MATGHRPSKAKGSKCIQRRIMLVSRDLGQDCFWTHLNHIIKLAEREKCETVMFALYSIYQIEGSPHVTPEAVFKNTTKYPSTVILESGHMEKEITFVQVFTRKNGKLKWRQFMRYFATSTASNNLKEAMVDEFRKRYRHISKDEALVICGESNIVRTIRSDKSCKGNRPIQDDFGFLPLLKSTKTKIVQNPWHTYCRRPEANWKRSALSRNKRLVVSVWNKWKKEMRGEARDPWVAFQDGKNISEKIKELKAPVAVRPDIRVSVLAI